MGQTILFGVDHKVVICLKIVPSRGFDLGKVVEMTGVGTNKA
jgi:hypothetical protein